LLTERLNSYFTINSGRGKDGGEVSTFKRVKTHHQKELKTIIGDQDSDHPQRTIEPAGAVSRA